LNNAGIKLKKIQLLSIHFGILFIILSSCSTNPYKNELAEAYYNLGNAYSDLGKLDEASLVFIKALKIDPDFSSAAYNLGIVQIQSEKYKDGILSLQELLKKQPDNTLVMKVLAWGYYKSGDSDGAVEVYKLILDIDIQNYDALNNITVLLMNDSEYTEAYKYLVQLEALETEDSNIYYNLGVSERELGISTGSVWFESAFDLDNNSEKFIIALLEALKIEGNYSKVIELYNILLDLNPDPSFLYDKAFILLTSIEDYSLGIPALELALQKEFSNEERIEELKSFPDLLDRDRILSVFIDNPIKKSDEEPVAESELLQGIDPPEESVLQE
jgi:tetratricopeptide (TPR) repeat protein